jgi:GT2 family glycosyltransferase
MGKQGWLSEMTRTVEAFPRIGALAYNFEPTSYPARTVNGFTVRIKERGNLGGACILIPKRTERVLGCWSEEYGLYGEEDADYGHRILLAGLLNVYMEDEDAGFHLPAGKAARIDHTTWQAADGREEVESAEYRTWKDAQRKHNVESGLFPRNLAAYSNGTKPLYIDSPFVEEYRKVKERANICSIIIPVYNKVEYTKQCLETLKLTINRHLGYEVIVVDNASSDATAEYLDSLAGAITVIRNDINLGFAKACNQGAKAARGKYLVFLNNDTVPHKGWLEALLAGAEHDKADICGAKLLYPDGKVQHAGVAFESHGIGYHIFKNFPSDAPAVNKKRFMQCVTGACMLISKTVFEELEGFDEVFLNGFEDVDLCLRAGTRKKKILYVPESVLTHFEETSEGRKTHDDRNLTVFLSRWGGKVQSDDDSFYLEEGFVKKRDTNGNVLIMPVSSESDRTSMMSRPDVAGHSELEILCAKYQRDPDDRENTKSLIVGLKHAGYHKDADRICSIHLRRHPGDSGVIRLQQKSM